VCCSTIEHSIQGLLTKEEIFQYNLYTDLLSSEQHFCLRVILAYVDVSRVADRCVVDRIRAPMEYLGVSPGKGVSGMLSEDDVKPVPMTNSEAGRKGGSTVRDRYGEDYYRRIGKKGGLTLKEKRGSEYYREIAQKGGQANVDKYGATHFSAMGKKGGNTTKSRQSPDFYSRIGKLGGEAKRRKKAIKDQSSQSADEAVS
jgi:general stress protein YciG